jgi:D-psicose/D-tagatose/L-ribulose 3-epimerase
MFKLGVDTWLWTSVFEEEHLYCIDEAERLGANAIDFSINDPWKFPTKKATERMKDSGMTVITSTALPLSYNPISPEKTERDAALEFMKRLVDITAMLGANVTGGVNHSASGYHSGKPRSEQELDWCAEYLRKLTDYARPNGIDIAMEPVKRFESHFINTAAQALDMIERVGAYNLKVHLDTFHMNIEEADFTEAILACGDKLVHLHLADSNRGAPGMGHVPWLDVFKALKKIGYTGAGCIETFNPETLDETGKMTYLTRRFAKTPRELVQSGFRYLNAVGTITYGE